MQRQQSECRLGDQQKKTKYDQNQVERQQYHIFRDMQQLEFQE
jgi:hypothetical protein